MHPEPIPMAGMYFGYIPVVDKAGYLWQPKTRLKSKVIEEADFHAFGVFGEHSESGATSIPRRALRIGPTGPYQCCQESPSGR